MIFVVLALVWAAVLVPKLLRHHDEVARTRAVDRFSASTRVLARREPVDGRSAQLVVTPTTASARTSEPRPGTLRRAAAKAAARRRRRVLGLLLAVLTGVVVALALGALPWWSAAVPSGLLGGYLVLCRVLVRRESAGSRALRSESPAAPTQTDPVVVAEPPATAEAVTQEVADPPVEEREPTGATELSAHEDTVTIRREDLEQAGSLWDPLPVTLPTYVGKPRARRTVRTIDLTAPTVASSGRDAADSRLVADAAETEPVEEPRRAVGS